MYVFASPVKVHIFDASLCKKVLIKVKQIVFHLPPSFQDVLYRFLHAVDYPECKLWG